jgi:hypothetical protein
VPKIRQGIEVRLRHARRAGPEKGET